MRVSLSLMLVAVLSMIGCSHDPVGSTTGGTTIPTPVVMQLASVRDGNPFGTFVHPGKGIPATITVSGFLPRTVVDPGSVEYLWPNDEAFPKAWTYAGLYNSGADTIMVRPAEGTLFTVEPGPDLANDSRFMDDLAFAVATINGSYNLGQVQFQIVSSGSGGSVRVLQDPNESGGAWTYGYQTPQGLQTGGRIVFQSIKPFWGHHLRRALTHELGHIACLSHLPPDAPPGLMGGPGESMDFSYAEKSLLNWMFLRPTYNRWEDDSTITTIPPLAAVHDGVLLCHLQ